MNEGAAVVLRVFDLLFAVGLGVGDEDVCVSARVLLHVFSGVFGELQGGSHCFGDLFIIGQFCFHLVKFFFHFAVFTVNAFVVSDDLVQEIIDFLFAVTTDGGFRELLIMDVHWCNHNLPPWGKFFPHFTVYPAFRQILFCQSVKMA